MVNNAKAPLIAMSMTGNAAPLIVQRTCAFDVKSIGVRQRGQHHTVRWFEVVNTDSEYFWISKPNLSN